MCAQKLDTNLTYYSLGPVPLSLEMRSFTGLELANLARLASWRSSEVTSLCLPSADNRHVTTKIDFLKWVLKRELSSSCLQDNQFLTELFPKTRLKKKMF